MMKSPCEMVRNVSGIKGDGKACKEKRQSEQARWEERQTGLERSISNSSNADKNIHPGGPDGEMMHVRSNCCHEGDEAEGEDDDLEEYESAGGQDLLAWEDDQSDELNLPASSKLLQIHVGDQDYQIYKCPLCDYNTLNVKYFRRHLRQHNADTLRCPFCLYESKIKYHMDRHIRSHTGAGLAKCKFCDFSSVRTDVLRSHMRMHEQEEPLFSCHRCEFTSNKSEELTWHARTHLEQKVFTCSECSYSTVRRGHMNRHMSNHQRKLLQCPCCEYSTRKFGLMSKHIENHKKIGEQIYCCAGCRYISNKAAHYKRHLESHRHKCSLCPFTTSRREFLYKHIDVKHKGAEGGAAGASGSSLVNDLPSGVEAGSSSKVLSSRKEMTASSPDKVIIKKNKFTMIRKSKCPAKSFMKNCKEEVVSSNCNVTNEGKATMNFQTNGSCNKKSSTNTKSEASNEEELSTNLHTTVSNEEKGSTNLQNTVRNEDTSSTNQNCVGNDDISSTNLQINGSTIDMSDALTNVKDPFLIKSELPPQIDSCGDFDVGENIADHLDVLITATDKQRTQHTVMMPVLKKKCKPVGISVDIPTRRNAPRKSKTRFKINFKSMFSSLITKSSKSKFKHEASGVPFVQRRSLDGKFYRKPADLLKNTPLSKNSGKRKLYDELTDKHNAVTPRAEDELSRASIDDTVESPLHKYLKLSSNKRGQENHSPVIKKECMASDNASTLDEPRAKKIRLEAPGRHLTPVPTALSAISSTSAADTPMQDGSAKQTSGGLLNVFCCTLCKFKTTTRKYLNRHLRRHERNACQLSSSEALASDAALKRLGGGEGVEGLQHSCPVCPFSTIHKGQLIEHMAVHLREQSCALEQGRLGQAMPMTGNLGSLLKQVATDKVTEEANGEDQEIASFVKVKQEPPDEEEEGLERNGNAFNSGISNMIRPDVAQSVSNLVASQHLNQSQSNQITPETLSNIVQLLIASRLITLPQDNNTVGQPSTSGTNTAAPLESSTSSLPLYTQLSLLANMSSSTSSNQQLQQPSTICPSAYEGIPEGTHVSLSGEEVVYSCAECTYTTTRKDHILRHHNQHTGKGMQYCPHCPYSTVRKEHMKRHIKLHVEGVLKCPQCDYETRRKEQMRLHELSHLDKDHLRCPHCSYITLRKEHMKRHLNRHCVVRAAQCRHCSYTTDRPERMTKHAQGLHPGEGGVEEVFRYIDTEQGLLTDEGERGSCAASVDGSDGADSRNGMGSPCPVKVEPLDPCEEASSSNAASEGTRANTEHGSDDSNSEECCALNFVDTCLADSDQDESKDSFFNVGQTSGAFSVLDAVAPGNKTPAAATSRSAGAACPAGRVFTEQDVVVKKKEPEELKDPCKVEPRVGVVGVRVSGGVGVSGGVCLSGGDDMLQVDSKDNADSKMSRWKQARKLSQSCVSERVSSLGGHEDYSSVPSDAEKLAKARAAKLILAEQQNVIMREIQLLLHKELLSSSPEQQKQLLTLQQLLQHNQLKQQQTDSDLVTLEAAMKPPSAVKTASLKPPPPLKVPKKTPKIPQSLNCPYCDYQATWNESLIKHIRALHVSTLFTCSIAGCGFKTARKDHYTFHVKNHTGENRMRCNFCVYETARPYHMRRHIVRKHPGSRATDFTKLGNPSSERASSSSTPSSSLGKRSINCPSLPQFAARPPVGIATSKASLAVLSGVPAKNVIYTKTFVSVREKRLSLEDDGDDKDDDDEREESADRDNSSGSEDMDQYGDEEVSAKKKSEESEYDKETIDIKHETTWDESSGDEEAVGENDRSCDSEDVVSDDPITGKKRTSANDLINLLLQNSGVVPRPPPALRNPAQLKGLKTVNRVVRLSHFSASSTSSPVSVTCSSKSSSGDKDLLHMNGPSSSTGIGSSASHSVSVKEESSPTTSSTLSPVPIARKNYSVPSSTSVESKTKSASGQSSDVISPQSAVPVAFPPSVVVGQEKVHRIILPNDAQLPEVASVLVNLHESLLQNGDTFLSQDCPTQCPICSFMSEWKATMKRHILRHLDPSRDLIQCELCSYNTYRSDHMRNHMMRHTGQGYLTCPARPACSYKTGRKDHMKRHIASCKACKEQQGEGDAQSGQEQDGEVELASQEQDEQDV